MTRTCSTESPETSAGAIVASFLAPAIAPSELKQIMTTRDFAAFQDEPSVFQHFKIFAEGTHSSWSPDPNAFELAKSLLATMSDALTGCMSTIPITPVGRSL